MMSEQLLQNQFQSDIEIYQFIVHLSKSQRRKMKPFPAEAAFITHVVFKIATFVFIYLQDVLTPIMGQLLNYEIIIMFVVIDFWFTKNYNGRKLLGLSWSFDLDQHGVQRFSYEARINEDFNSQMNFNVFWFVQLVYIGYPWVHIYVFFRVQFTLNLEQIVLIGIQLLVFIGGITNLFLFYKAYSCSKRNIQKLKKTFGKQFVIDLGKNSLIAHL